VIAFLALLLLLVAVEVVLVLPMVEQAGLVVEAATNQVVALETRHQLRHLKEILVEMELKLLLGIRVAVVAVRLLLEQMELAPEVAVMAAMELHRPSRVLQ
jgi:hypothetical protein